MKKILLLTIIFLGILRTSYTQNWQWAKEIGGNFSYSGEDRGISSLTTSSGSNYFTGSFQGEELKFNSQNAVNGYGNTDIFLVKYNSNGNIVWSRSDGSLLYDEPIGMVMDNYGFLYVLINSKDPQSNTNPVIGIAKYDTLGNPIYFKYLSYTNSYVVATSITIDKNNNLYIAGSYYGGGTGFFVNTTLPSFGGFANNFILKCDTGGNIINSAIMPNLSTNILPFEQSCNGLQTDTLGNIYIAGVFDNDSISIGGNGLKLYKNPTNNKTLFIIKYDSLFNAIWAQTSTGGTSMNGGLAIDNNQDVLIYGETSNNIQFGNISLNGNGCFLMKFSSNGLPLLGKIITNGKNLGNYEFLNLEQNTTKITSNNNIYISGYFNSSTLTIDSTTINRVGNNDIFLAKFSSLGNLVWIKQLSSSLFGYTNGIYNDIWGNVNIVGTFSGNLNINPSTILNSKGYKDIFSVKYDSSGNLLDSKSYGSGSFNNQIPYAITNDINNNIYIHGFYGSDSIYFGTTSLGSGGFFMAKYDNNGNNIWSKQLNNNFPYVNEMAVDSSFNIYTTGDDFLLRKYDSLGNFLWQKTPILKPYNEGLTSSRIIVDSLGFIYVLGDFTGDTMIVDFIQLIMPPIYQNVGNCSASFIIKFDLMGNVIWGKIVVAGKSNGATGLDVNDQGDIVIVGSFYGSAIIDGVTNITNSGFYVTAVYYAKLDNMGNLTNFQYQENDGEFQNVIFKGKSKYIIGTYSINNTFSWGTYNFTSLGYSDFILIKYDSLDNIVWAKSFGGTSAEFFRSIKIDSRENIYITGLTGSTNILFDTINFITGLSINNQSETVGFLATLDSAGNFLTVSPYSGYLAIDNLDNLALYDRFKTDSLSFGSYNIYNSDTSLSVIQTYDLFLSYACPILSLNLHANGSNSICQGDTVILNCINDAGLSYQWKKNGTNIAGATNSSYKATQSGLYSVIVSNMSGCQYSEQINIVVNPLPTASLTNVGSLTFCDGSSVTLNANTGIGLNYEWQNTGLTIGANNASYLATIGGAYTVIVTDSNGCQKTSLPKNVVVNPTPIASITTSGATSFCAGDTVTITTPLQAGYTYQWKNNNVNIAGATNNSYDAYQLGSYIVVVTLGTCKDTSIAVIINSLPAATLTNVGALTFCDGNLVTLNANTGLGLNYEWQNSGATIIGANTDNYLATATGIYTVTVTDSNGCQKTSLPKNVVVNPTPVTSITTSGATSFCIGDTVTITTPLQAGYTYQWKKNNVNIAGATSNSYAAYQSGAYTVVATLGTCEDTSVIADVIVNPLPSATLTNAGSLTFCDGSSVTLNANMGAGLSYEWQNSGVMIVGANAVSYLATVAGTYTVTVTDSNGCQKTSLSKNVVVNPTPIASITTSSAPSICIGDTIAMTTPLQVGYTYQWKKNNINISGATTNNYSAYQSGAYTVVVTLGTCKDTSTATNVIVNPLPFVGTNFSNLLICQGVSLTLWGTGASTYSWQGNIQDSVAFIPNATATYWVEGTDTNGCSNTSTITILVEVATVVANSSANPVCQGDSITLNGSGVNLYTWDNGVQNGIPFIATTTQTYTVIGETLNGCADTSSITITVNPLPSPPIISQLGGVLSVSQSYTSYQWYNGQNTIAGATTYSYTPSQNGIYSVQVSDSNGCIVESDTVNFIVNGSENTLTTLFSIYPNPTNYTFTIEFTKQDNYSMNLYNTLGQLLISSKLIEQKNEIDISKYASGVYFIEISNSNTQRTVQKIMKE